MRTHIPNSVLDAQRLATHDHRGSLGPRAISLANDAHSLSRRLTQRLPQLLSKQSLKKLRLRYSPPNVCTLLLGDSQQIVGQKNLKSRRVTLSSALNL